MGYTQGKRLYLSNSSSWSERCCILAAVALPEPSTVSEPSADSDDTAQQASLNALDEKFFPHLDFDMMSAPPASITTVFPRELIEDTLFEVAEDAESSYW